MSDYSPQGYNGVSIADRTVRQLGIEVANAQIALATQNARLEEIAETAGFVNFGVWTRTEVDTSHEGAPGGQPTYVVPTYQVEAVQRLLGLLGR